MLVNTSTQRYLLANLRRRGRVEHNLGQVGFDRHDATSFGCRANVDHENLTLGEFLNLRSDERVSATSERGNEDGVGRRAHLRLLLVVSLDTEQSSQEEVVDLNLGVNGGQRALRSKNLSDESITTCQLRVDDCRMWST